MENKSKNPHLGFGIMRLPEVNGRIDMIKTTEMIEEYMRGDFCYFDLHPLYMNRKAENIIKELVVDRYPRDSFLLADKMPFHIELHEDYERIFEKSLEVCGTDYFDYYLLHALSNEVYDLHRQKGGFEFLQEKKIQGKIRKIGFSFHDQPELLDQILTEHPETEFVQLQINFFDWDSDTICARGCYEVARKHNTQIFVMEPLKGGSLLEPAGQFRNKENIDGMNLVELGLKFVASLPGVSIVLSGMSDVEHIRQNRGILTGEKAVLQESEKELLSAFCESIRAENKIPCTTCHYCENECPYDIAIPDIISLLNAAERTGRNDRTYLGRFKIFYDNYTHKRGKAGDCIRCGRCERKCPQKIAIIRHMEMAAETFERRKKNDMYTDIKSVQILIKMMKEYGIRNVVISPGTRHFPLVHSIEHDDFFTCWSIVDERSAAYFAMGIILEKQEPVAVACTSGTAAANYHSAAAEAYFQKMPLLFLTADRNNYYYDQRENQMVPQDNMFGSLCRKAVNVPQVYNKKDEWYCYRIINEALLELNHHGSGPVQINYQIEEKMTDFNTATLPDIRRIRRISNEEESEWKEMAQRLQGKRILVLCGQGQPVEPAVQHEMECFFHRTDSVFLTDHTSNYHGEGALQLCRLLTCMKPNEFEEITPDLVISIRKNYLIPIKGLLKYSKLSIENWDVNEEGKVTDEFHFLSTVFECDTEEFFVRMNAILSEQKKERHDYYDLMVEKDRLLDICEFDYSNLSVMRQFSRMIPAGSYLHLGNLRNATIAQFFPLADGVITYAHNGTTTIDGSLSTFIGQAAVTERLSFCFIGDLSFFYDMGAIWNEYVGSNVRILLINNGGGEEFHVNLARMSDTVDDFTAAGHNQQAEGWAKACGFEYLSACDEEQMKKMMPRFVANKSEKPIIFEIFTSMDTDADLWFAYIERQNKKLKEAGRMVTRKIREKVPVKAEKSVYNYNTIRDWMSVKQMGRSLEEYFIAMQYERIAVYGLGEIGGLLLQELGNTQNVKIICGIDRNANRLSQYIPVIKPEEELPKTDAIIVTATFAFEAIRNMLQKKVDCPIISLDDVTGWFMR